MDRDAIERLIEAAKTAEKMRLALAGYISSDEAAREWDAVAEEVAAILRALSNTEGAG